MSPVENTVSNDFGSTFVDSIDVFDYRLPSVILTISEDSTIFGLNEPPKVTNHTPSRETRMPLTAKNLQEKDKYGKVVVSYKRTYVHKELVN